MTATPASATPSPHRIDGMRPDAPARAPFGPYAVGRETLRLTNPDVVNAVALETGQGPARHDRPMTLSLFYPARGPVEPSPMDSLLRDGTTRFQLLGQSAEGAPVADGGAGFPLILISHG
ncbi:MAG: dienelactone hydrolase, partial [Alphaproteobacteria bacterium]